MRKKGRIQRSLEREAGGHQVYVGERSGETLSGESLALVALSWTRSGGVDLCETRH